MSPKWGRKWMRLWLSLTLKCVSPHLVLMTVHWHQCFNAKQPFAVWWNQSIFVGPSLVVWFPCKRPWRKGGKKGLAPAASYFSEFFFYLLVIVMVTLAGFSPRRSLLWIMFITAVPRHQSRMSPHCARSGRQSLPQRAYRLDGHRVGGKDTSCI